MGPFSGKRGGPGARIPLNPSYKRVCLTLLDDVLKKSEASTVDRFRFDFDFDTYITARYQNGCYSVCADPTCWNGGKPSPT
jgi:hypothetical protein